MIQNNFGKITKLPHYYKKQTKKKLNMSVCYALTKIKFILSNVLYDAIVYKILDAFVAWHGPPYFGRTNVVDDPIGD